MLQKTGKDLLHRKYVGWLWFLDEIVLKKVNSICLDLKIYMRFVYNNMKLIYLKMS